jgi:hypothetical protein
MKRCAYRRKSQSRKGEQIFRNRWLSSEYKKECMAVDIFEFALVFEKPLLPFTKDTHERRIILGEVINDFDEL